MRRNSLFTAISLILVLTLLSFGVYSLLQPLSRTRNQISFRFSDRQLHLEITADAQWDSGNENSHFETATEDGELDNEIWLMPNIVFSTDGDNELREAEIMLTIVNRSPEKEVKITITNVAFDSDPAYADNPRFITSVRCQDGATGMGVDYDITSTDHILTPTNIAKSPDIENANSKIITFKYQLLRENIDFDFTQNIVILFETV